MMATNHSIVGLSPWEVHPDDFPADGGADQKLLFMLNFAILAPSCRNAQPWLFRLQGHEVELVADRKRSLPVADPLDRELIMSCGAALHHLRVAARYYGCECRIEPFPDVVDPNVLARVSLGMACDNGAEDFLMFDAIQRRRTNRFPFLEDPIANELLAVSEQTAEREGAWLHLFSDVEVRNIVADLVEQSERAQWHDKGYREELAKWLTPNSSLRRDGIPGYARGKGDLAAYSEPMLVRAFDLGNSRAAQDREIALQAPILAVVGADEDTPEAWLRAGQALSAVLLRACSEDVCASFLNQVIEVHETRMSLAELTGRGGLPQTLLRLGFGAQLRPTPRRSLAQAMLKSKHGVIRIG